MTMSIVKSGSDFHLINDQDQIHMKELPPAVYTLQFSDLTGFYLTESSSFELPPKIYSNVKRHASRIVQTYLDRPKNTGVLLCGEKGSGKTLTTKLVCLSLIDRKIPTIIINQPFVGDRFNEFINGLPQKVAVLFDEFEKVYDREKQPKLLTLFDGTGSSECLFLLTVNNRFQLDSHLENRPGRIYYCIDFNSLSHEFVREYCDDRLDEKEHIEQLVSVVSSIPDFNFDMLQSVVEEMNRYEENVLDALGLLNIKMNSGQEDYNIALMIDGVKVEDCDRSIYLNPLRNNGFAIALADEDADEPEFGVSDITHVDAVNGVYSFERGSAKLRLSKIKTQQYQFGRTITVERE